jgi:hypothetical protein
MDIQHIKNYFITNKYDIIILSMIGIFIHIMINIIFYNNNKNHINSIEKKDDCFRILK